MNFEVPYSTCIPEDLSDFLPQYIISGNNRTVRSKEPNLRNNLVDGDTGFVLDRLIRSGLSVVGSALGLAQINRVFSANGCENRIEQTIAIALPEFS